MSSNLKVNTILPSTGTTIGIGTVGGLINVVGNIDVNSTSGISTFNGLEISGIVTAKAGAAVTYYGDGSNLTGITDNVVTINNNANNRIITGSGSANTLEAESTLTYSPSILTITNASGASEITLVTPSANDSGVYFNDGSNAGALTYNHSDNSMRFRVNSTEKLRITSDGKIGIGENNPTREFVLKNAGGNCQLSITSGTSNSAYLNLGDTDDDNIGSIYYDNSNNRIVFRANTTDIVRMESDGNIRILDGNLRIATAGHGIDFSATGDAGGMTSELLDDYEEGSWTPALQFDVNGSGLSYGTRAGTYTKIGRKVTVIYYMVVSSGASSSDYFARLTLPFTGASVGHQDCRVRQWNNGYSDWFLSIGGGAPVFFHTNGTGSGANYARGDDVNGYALAGEYTYFI